MEFKTNTGLHVLGIHSGIVAALLLLVWKYHARRRLQPIKSRFYWHAEISLAFILVETTFEACAIEFLTSGNCLAFTFVPVVAFSSTVPQLLRAAHLFSAFEVSKHIVCSHSYGCSPEHKKSLQFFVKYAAYIQSMKIQIAVLVFTFVLHASIWAGTMFAGSETCASSSSFLMGTLVVGFFYLAATLYLALNVATLSDGLYIRRELLSLALARLVAFVAFIPLYFLVGIRNALPAAMVGSYSVVLIQVGMPLYKSYVWENLKQAHGIGRYNSQSLEILRQKPGKLESQIISSSTRYSNPSDLEDLLDTKDGYDAFLEYCRKQLNHENVLYYSEVKSLENRMLEEPGFLEKPAFIESGLYIYSTFIAPHAELQLNLSALHHENFKRAGFARRTQSIDPTAAYRAIRVAFKETFLLMYNESFLRFLGSPAYEKLQT